MSISSTIGLPLVVALVLISLATYYMVNVSYDPTLIGNYGIEEDDNGNLIFVHSNDTQERKVLSMSKTGDITIGNHLLMQRNSSFNPAVMQAKEIVLVGANGLDTTADDEFRIRRNPDAAPITETDDQGNGVTTEVELSAVLTVASTATWA